jgi:hypothetical protein
MRPNDVDLEPVVGNAVEKSCAPFDHHYRSLEVDIQIIELDRAAEAIGIHVHQGHAFRTRMRPCQHEGRAGYRASHAERSSETPRERRLASTQLTVQQHEVTRAQPGCHASAELLHVVGSRNRELDHGT